MPAVDGAKAPPREQYPDSYPDFWRDRRAWSTALDPPITRRYPFPLEHVVAAHFAKFPDPAHPEIREVRTVQSSEACEGTQQFLRREVVAENTLPWIFRRIVHVPEMLFEEESAVDSRARVMHLRSANVSLQSVGFCEEESRFEADPADPEATLFRQMGGCTVTASWVGPLRKPLEAFVTRLFEGHGRAVAADFEAAMAAAAAAD